jgi:hypothetical protein
VDRKCSYCHLAKPQEDFVSVRKCWECAQSKKCYTCKQVKPIEEFAQNGKGCRECRDSNKAQEVRSQREADRYRANREGHLAQSRVWKNINAPHYKRQQSEYARSHRLAVRAAVLAHYGAKCACCGESEPMFLTVDHVEGNGAAHRRLLRKTDMWGWLVSNNYPPGFQLLCFNCNAGQYRNGGRCPHVVEE